MPRALLLAAPWLFLSRIRTSDSSGHGMGTALSEEIGAATDIFAFLFDQLGVVPR